MHSAVLLKAEVQALQKANQVVSRRHRRKKRRIQQGGILTIQEGQVILTQTAVEEQIREETRKGGIQLRKSEMRQQRCGTCGETGHNARTCQKDQETTIE
jgi:hypothetical protein